MSVRVVESDDGDIGLLVDTETERPIPMQCFADGSEAHNFLTWFAANHGQSLADLLDDVKRGTVTMGNALALVEVARALWTEIRCDACGDTGCECPECGRSCAEKHAARCSEGAAFDADMRGQ